jgi:hypothetical protein
VTEPTRHLPTKGLNQSFALALLATFSAGSKLRK